LIALTRAHRLLTTAHLELTKRCNLHCYHCYVAGSGEELDADRWLRLVDELEMAGCLRVTLTGGEIGLRSDWLVIAERVKQRRMALSVLTNGTLLTATDIERLAGLRPLAVAVSIYGGSRDAHERVTGVPGSFDLSLATISALRGHDVPCRVSCTLMPDTFAEFRRIVDLASALDCEYMFDPTVVPRSDGNDSVVKYRLSADKVQEFFLDERIMGKSREGRAVRIPGDLPERVPGNCSAGITSVTVEANGDVLPCFGLRPSFGNIAVDSLNDLWHGAAAEEHRRRMGEPLEDCLQCDLKNLCSVRCPRLALAENGSLSARSSRACELAAINSDLRMSQSEMDSGGSL